VSDNSILSKLFAILRDEAEVFLLESITGTGDAERLAGLIDSFCFEQFNSRVSTCYFACLSMGASFGLRLVNGNDIFIKISKLRTETSGDRGFTVDDLTAMSRMQEALYNANYPCPSVILHPKKYQGAIYTVNGYVDIGEQKDAHCPNIRRASAHGLAELIKRFFSISLRVVSTKSIYIKLKTYFLRPIIPIRILLLLHQLNIAQTC